MTTYYKFHSVADQKMILATFIYNPHDQTLNEVYRGDKNPDMEYEIVTRKLIAITPIEASVLEGIFDEYDAENIRYIARFELDRAVVRLAQKYLDPLPIRDFKI